MLKYGSLQTETMTTSKQENFILGAIRKKKRKETISDIFRVVKFRIHVFWDPE